MTINVTTTMLKYSNFHHNIIELDKCHVFNTNQTKISAIVETKSTLLRDQVETIKEKNN